MILASKFLRRAPFNQILHSLKPIPLASQPLSLYLNPHHSFFWNKSKKTEKIASSQKSENPDKISENDKNSQESSEESDTLDFTKQKNLSFIIKKIIADNSKKQPLLPPKSAKYADKKTLVLEIDETLLFTFFPDEHEGYLMAPARDYDIYLDLPEHNTFLSIYLRNHLKEFLAYIGENFEPILFCNGVKVYVDKLMDIIDKDKIFVHRLYQDSCDRIFDADENLNELTKDLQKLNRDLSQTILIDARAFNLWCYPDNCNENYCYLIYLMDFIVKKAFLYKNMKGIVWKKIINYC